MGVFVFIAVLVKDSSNQFYKPMEAVETGLCLINKLMLIIYSIIVLLF